MGLIKIIKKIRNEFYRRVIYRNYNIDEGFHCGARVRIWGKNQVTIGKNFYIGRDSFIESDVIIGDNVLWANRVALVGRYDHNYQQIGTPIRKAMQIRDKDYNWKGKESLTTIGNDVWVGYNSTIMSGITIGEGCIIAACSLVTKDTEPYSIYAGSPAKKIKDRFNNTRDLEEHLKLISGNAKN